MGFEPATSTWAIFPQPSNTIREIPRQDTQTQAHTGAGASGKRSMGRWRANRSFFSLTLRAS